MSEREFSALIVDVARLGGWHRYHTFDSRRSSHGFPDWVFTRDGRLIFAELKSEKGKLSPNQEIWIAELKLVAGLNDNVQVFVWRPSDWDEIVSVLTGRSNDGRD